MAKGAIKGLTVKIGGDTTELGKAIDDSNKKTRSLQSELREVDKLLKYDPTNVELLAQKQQLLTEAVDETTQILETLESAQESVTDQFEKGEIGEDQYRAFQREIIATQKKLDDLNKQLNETTDAHEETAEAIEETADEAKTGSNKLDDLADAVEDAGDEAEDSSDGFTIMGGAIADLTANAISAAISAIGDFIGSLFELDEATAEYRTMQAKIAGSAEEFGYSFEFAQSKYNKFYKYLGDDQAATNAITNLMGMGVSINTVSALTDGAIAVWTAYGDSIPIEGLTESINATVQTGVVTGQLGDALEWAGISQDEFNRKLAKCSNEQERAELIASVLNGTYGDSKRTYDEMNESVLEANEAQLDLKETQAELGETIAPVNTAFTNLKNKALQAIVPLVKKAADGFMNLLGWLKDHPTALKVITAVVVALAAAFGVLAVALGIQALITGVQKAFALLNTTLLANPIVLIVAAVAALVAAFVYLWNNCEAFREFWINLWNKVKGVVEPIWEAIKGYFSAAWDWISGVWAEAAPWFKNLWETIKSFFKSEEFALGLSIAWTLIKGVWNNAVAYFRLMWENLKVLFEFGKVFVGSSFVLAWDLIKATWSNTVGFFKTMWENIKAVFGVVKVFLSGAFNTAWVAIKAVWDTVTGFFSAIWETIKGIFSVVKNVLSGNWREAWEGIKGIVRTWANYFRGVWNNIKSVFSAVGSWFSSTFSAAWSAIKQIVSNWANYFKLVWSNIKNVFSSVGTWFRRVFRAAWTAIKGVFSNWGTFFSDLWETIKTTFTDLGTKIGSAVSDSVKAGINGMIGWVESTVNDAIGLINGAIDIINKVPGVDIGHVGTIEIPRLAKGGIVDSPTLAEIAENGREAVIPLENNLGWINELARSLSNQLPANNTPDVATLERLDRIYDRLNRLQIVLDNGTLVGEMLERIDAGLADRELLRARGV